MHVDRELDTETSIRSVKEARAGRDGVVENCIYFLKVLEWARLIAGHVRQNSHCIEEHLSKLKSLGETTPRLSEWKNWRKSPAFTAREKAAFRLGEAISEHEAEHNRHQILEAAQRYFSMEEIIQLVLAVTAVNDWIDLHESPSRVMIVEDDPMDRELLLHQLKKAHLTENVFFIPDGEQAFEVIEKCDKLEEWKLIALFLDLRLPKLSGIELLRRIRQLPGKKDLPVIVMTASNDPADKAECERLDVMSYVNKPVSFSSFSKAVADIFHRAARG
jgi:CheY-like chemotaxis protein